jgi:hypothetical protein
LGRFPREASSTLPNALKSSTLTKEASRAKIPGDHLIAAFPGFGFPPETLSVYDLSYQPSSFQFLAPAKSSRSGLSAAGKILPTPKKQPLEESWVG